MQNKSKLEKIFTTASITLAFVVVGLLVLGLMQIMPLNRFFLDVLLILGILCFGCISCLPAVRMLTQNKKDIYAYVILGLTGFVCLLWIIFVFVGRGLIDALANSTADVSHLSNAWGYTKTVIFLTIQTSFANLIITNLYHLKKTMLPFQIVMYVSNFIVNLWLSIVVLSIVVTSQGLAFTAGWLLDSAFFATVFVLALVFSGLASTILRRINRRRERELVDEAILAAKALEMQKLNANQAKEEEVNEQPKQENKDDPWSQE